MAKHWNRAAMRFAHANYSDRQEMLDITFENGDHFLVAVEAVLPWTSETAVGSTKSRMGVSTAIVKPVPWGRIRIGETGDVLEIPANDTIIEIPWDRIRAIADPDFRAHLAERAHERAQRIGGRIRTMRLESGLTVAALADKVGISEDVIANLEAGKIDPETNLIQHIAGVMGRGLRDFAAE